MSELWTENNSLIRDIFTYIITLLISISLVINTIAILILSIENEIKIDISKIRYYFLREKIENFIVIKKSNMDIVRYRQDHITFLKITLFI